MRGLFLCLAFFAAVLVSGCSSETKVDVVGRWVSDKTSLLTLQFYADGKASLSSTGFFSLRWQRVEEKLVRIEALENRIIFNFRIRVDAKGPTGTLELVGFDTLVFRKIAP